MYLLIEHKIKTASPIFSILTFLSHDFSNLKFEILLFIVRFILFELPYSAFKVNFFFKLVKVFQKQVSCCEQFSL